ncbi:MAG TPA: thioredoxin domain-containing protein [Polyangiaceae bacterium]|nr:thioredoxin domain-containing protein [Polyangiaceae bacterium]
MNKGTACVGFLLSFLAGSGLVWGVARSSSNSGERALSATERSPSSPIPITAGDPSWGKPEAPVTIVELSDLECPFCARALATIARVQKEYGPEKVRLVWKHNPLPGHRNARPAAEAAATVQGLGGDFWKFSELAFANQKQLTPENFVSWAAEAGLERQRFQTALAVKRYTAKVEQDLALARQLGVDSAPQFRINGKPLIGAQPYETFAQLIDEQLAAAEALTQSGVPRERVSLRLTRDNFKAVVPAPARKEPPTRPEDTTVWNVPVRADDPSRGSDRALVTIVEFSDFQCPYCARVESTLSQLLDEYQDDLRIVWKDNPMSYHPRARPAAYLARFAQEQSGNRGFWAAHRALFASQTNLEDSGLEAIAKQLGLSWEGAKKAADSGAYRARIDASADLALDFGANGTPHFFINGRHLVGAQPYEQFKQLVDAGLQDARRLLGQGVSRDKVFQELMKSGKGAPEPEKKQLPAAGPDSPFKGAAKARVVIQEFSDFQCPFCSRVTPTVERLLKEYPKDVKLVWRHMPLSFHSQAALAAEAAQEAFEQQGNAGFWSYHDRLFANQSALERADLERYAGEIGLDLERFRRALDRRTHKARVERDSQLGQRAALGGTPGFVINGYFVSGAQPFAVFDRLIQRALKEG